MVTLATNIPNDRLCYWWLLSVRYFENTDDIDLRRCRRGSVDEVKGQEKEMTQYLVKPNDIPDLIDCMIEAFKETDKVSAKMLAEKMIQKTGRPFTYQNVSYLYSLLGFVACPVEHTAERFIMRDDERIARIKADEIKYRETAKVGHEINMSTSPYAKQNHENYWNYFKASSR